jgi:hypothetical protein
MSGQVTDWTRDAPLPQAVEAAVPEGGDIALDGGAAQADDLGRLGAAEAAVEKPQHEHLAADVFLGVGVTFGVNDLLLLLGQSNPQPSHSESLGGRTR